MKNIDSLDILRKDKSVVLGISWHCAASEAKEYFLRVKLHGKKSYAYFPVIPEQLLLYLSNKLILREILPNPSVYTEHFHTRYSPEFVQSDPPDPDELSHLINKIDAQNTYLGNEFSLELNQVFMEYLHGQLYLAIGIKPFRMINRARRYAYFPVSIKGLDSYFKGHKELFRILPPYKSLKNIDLFYCDTPLKNQVANIDAIMDTLRPLAQRAGQEFNTGPELLLNSSKLKEYYTRKYDKNWHNEEGQPNSEYLNWIETKFLEACSLLKNAVCPHCGGSGTIKVDGHLEECEWCYDQGDIIEILNE
jgi:hypothetical protein